MPDLTSIGPTGGIPGPVPVASEGTGSYQGRSVTKVSAEKQIPDTKKTPGELKSVHKYNVKTHTPTPRLQQKQSPSAIKHRQKQQQQLVQNHLIKKGYTTRRAKKMAASIVRKAGGKPEKIIAAAKKAPLTGIVLRTRNQAIKSLASKGYSLADIRKYQQQFGMNAKEFLVFAEKQPSARLRNLLRQNGLNQPPSS